MSTKEQRNLIFKILKYEPTLEQDKVHSSFVRQKLAAGGERAGKSKLSAMEYMGRFWETPLLWLTAADYERTRAEFDYICEGFSRLGVPYEASKRIDPGEILVSGGRWKIVTKSAKDPRTLAMEAPDGEIICEASQIDYEAYLRLRGRAAEKRAWIMMSGTFETSLGWYPELYTRWNMPNDEDAASFSLPSWSNLAVYPGGRQDPEILALEKIYSQEWFMERCGGVPCPPKGLVFNEFRNNIHTGFGGKYEFDKNKMVYLAVDPGFAAAYSVEVCQKDGDYLYVVDEVFERGLVTSDVIKVCKQRPWWNKVVGGAIDIAGTQHQAMAAPAETWLKEGGVHLRSQKLQIHDGIERMKTYLLINPVTSMPLLHINAKCKGLISELGGCPNPITGTTLTYVWKQDKEGNTIGETPEDKNNHATKALSYLLIDLFGHSAFKARAKIKFF